eukprot:scaffold26094_cov100-Isochrysis_galbana.AAC.4
MALMGPSCISTATGSPRLSLHTRTVASSEEETTCTLSGETTTSVISAAWPRRVCCSRPVVVHQVLTWPSSAPVTRRRPVRSNTTQYAAHRCPRSAARASVRPPLPASRDSCGALSRACREEAAVSDCAPAPRAWLDVALLAARSLWTHRSCRGRTPSSRARRAGTNRPGRVPTDGLHRQDASWTGWSGARYERLQCSLGGGGSVPSSPAPHAAPSRRPPPAAASELAASVWSPTASVKSDRGPEPSSVSDGMSTRSCAGRCACESASSCESSPWRWLDGGRLPAAPVAFAKEAAARPPLQSMRSPSRPCASASRRSAL